ncbi:MAG: class I SAM-dependent methyltransferase [Merismopedia sp. SIO2A8]|nr:class I SAM-dependent methyltransferase [Symploca sp. SIO2B6]NET53144.1 class I SAM-dependent methyltransferase [Merismopedia sp. SIO2A8]
MKIPSFEESYNKQTKELIKEHDIDKAMSLAVGGDFEAVGQLEYALLLQYGLARHHCIIDVGCGSGRLGFQLRKYLQGTYIGMDVVQELLEYAETKCNRLDWKFYKAPGLSIPEQNDYADFICFFSVFTHLLHEESYKYLEEAARVIKSKGKIIFSFLEFKIPSHWWIFQQVLADKRHDKVLNQFLSRDAIESWAQHLGLYIVDIHDGDKSHIKLNNVVKWDDGREMVGEGNLGQSVCVLTK